MEEKKTQNRGKPQGKRNFCLICIDFGYNLTKEDDREGDSHGLNQYNHNAGGIHPQ